jgi:hypothetical protein
MAPDAQPGILGEFDIGGRTMSSAAAGPQVQIFRTGPPELKEPDSSLELLHAAQSGNVSFAQVFRALYEGRLDRKKTTREDVVDLERYVYPDLLTAFEKVHGPIVKSFYANLVEAGAVVTRAPSGRLELAIEIWWDQVGFNAHEARVLYSRIQALVDQINSFLGTSPPVGRLPHIGPTLRYGQESHDLEIRLMFEIARDLIGSINREQWAYADRYQRAPRTSEERLAEPSPRHVLEIADLNDRLDSAEKAYVSSAKRAAQQWYWRGASQTAVICVVLLAATVAVSGVAGSWRPTDVALLLAVTALSGALGAIVSVLQRMAAGSLEISYEAEPEAIKRNGYFRPLLGAIFGLVIYALLAGGLVAINPSGTASKLAFYAALAFVAGFSERFARDMLSTTESLASKEADPSKGVTSTS